MTIRTLILVFFATAVNSDGLGIPRGSIRQARSAASNTVCQNLSKKALQMTNAFRAKKRLPRLVWHPALAEIARKHSGTMANHIIEFGHEGFQERLQHLPLKTAAENVYMSNHEQAEVARAAVNGWITSPGHLKNLVGQYTHCGIGVYKNAEGFWYFTQIFATL